MKTNIRRDALYLILKFSTLFIMSKTDTETIEISTHKKEDCEFCAWTSHYKIGITIHVLKEISFPGFLTCKFGVSTPPPPPPKKKKKKKREKMIGHIIHISPAYLFLLF